jgi:hypothetical protein
MNILRNKAAARICLLSLFLFPGLVSASEPYVSAYDSGTPSQDFDATFGPYFSVILLVGLAIVVVQIIAMYKVFQMAGKPGWAVLVPIYNTWVLAEVGGKPGWMGIVASVISAVPLVGPVVSLVFWIMILVGVAKMFGRGAGFGVGLAFLSFVFFPILAFSSGSQQFTTATGISSVQPISEETIPAQPQQRIPVNV